MERSSGILMPIASLASEYGIGCFDKAAYEFVDSLKAAGQTYWQILPMGPTGFGDSPYQSFSTFAGNPYFISLQALIDKGYISEEDLVELSYKTSSKKVRYDVIYDLRFKALKKAFQNSKIESDSSYIEFVNENSDWLLDYALFMAIKDSKSGQSFLYWEDAIKNREPEAMVSYKNKLLEDVNFYQFLQYEFMLQWKKLKEYANQNGIKIIGDIPIYVALDSADVWANSELFQFKDGFPVKVAGCPPDAFSKTGQLWGNPLYNWSYHSEHNFEWWIKRIKRCFSWYDVVRIDHFRGFDEYYAIDFGEKTAINGSWEKGPGLELFTQAKKELGDLDIIAEDLGFLTASVKEMLKESGYPGMKVLQFAFDSREDSDYLPYRYGRNSVVYTGTHDNQTTYVWWKELAKEDKQVALRYLNRGRFTSRKKLTWDLISLAMSSVSDLCIIPMNDYLCLGKEARINHPSTIGGNWEWRMKKGAFDDLLCERIWKLTKLYGRMKREEKN